MTASGVSAPDLRRLFAPRAVALVGVPGDLDRPGARPLRFLRRHGYPGAIHPVNPRYREIGGLPAWPTLAAVPGPVDVAWIGLPAAQSPVAIRECGEAGIPFAVVLGAGFVETGAAGAATQARLVEAARTGGVRLLGPNTVGFVNAWDRVALTFSSAGELPALAPGPVALLSQSGGMGGCLLNQAVDRGLGVGLFVSSGNEADLGLADYLDWLVDDGRARAVACLVEQVRAPERVAAAVRRALARGIPVVALKLGTSETGARAARSHTGSLVGAGAAWRAWARAAGLIEAGSLGELVETAAYLATTPAPAGRRAAMVTTSGGIGVVLADALEPRGFAFSPLGEATRRRLAGLLPGYATVTNPVDLTAGLPETTFGEALTAVIGDPGVDVVVVPLTMATAGAGRDRAERVVEAARGAKKPLAVCWPGGSLVREGYRVLETAGVPLFHSVEGCAAALGASLEYRELRARRPGGAEAPLAIDFALPARGGVLTWGEARALLLTAGLPLADEAVVRTEAEARAIAARLAYPVAVKLLGPLHKTEADGVRLGLLDEAAMIAAVRELLPRGGACVVQPMVDGVEALVGAIGDPALGPFVLVAPGGVHAELYAERAMRPAPVGREEAGAMVGECRALAALLAGYRGRPAADAAALATVVARVSALAAALGPRLAELDLNPVIVGRRGATVVDARVALAEGPGSPCA